MQLLFIYLSIVIFSFGCKSFNQKEISKIPAELRAIYLFLYSNDTFVPQINRSMQIALQGEVNRRHFFRVQKESQNARIWLTGEMTDYAEIGRLFDSNNQVTHYEMIIRAKTVFSVNPNFSSENSKTQPYAIQEFTAQRLFSSRNALQRSRSSIQGVLLRQLAYAINKHLEYIFLDPLKEQYN